jgi:hypothetical protein
MKVASLLSDRRELPDYIFARRFHQYMFFDADIGSSALFLADLQSILRKVAPDSREVDVFCASDRNLLDSIGSGESWVARFNLLQESLADAGNPYGYILSNPELTFVVYQKVPASIGVLAFDLPNTGATEDMALPDSFISCEMVRKWLNHGGYEFDQIGRIYGSEFLETLAANYCS